MVLRVGGLVLRETTRATASRAHDDQEGRSPQLDHLAVASRAACRSIGASLGRSGRGGVFEGALCVHGDMSVGSGPRRCPPRVATGGT